MPLGVVGLPRNYELFYEAFVSSNDSLRKSLMTLGARPPQNDLDQLSRDYFAQSNREGIVENAHDAVTRKVDAVMALLMRERNSLEKYGVILDRTSEGLSGITHVSREMLQKIAGIMAAATDTTIDRPVVRTLSFSRTPPNLTIRKPSATSGAASFRRRSPRPDRGLIGS